MSESDRGQRADAQRNRAALLAAAAEVFREQGLEVGVGEIARRAGVGRGTLFRNFPTKQDLIAAIVVERMREGVAAANELLADPSRGDAIFEFISEMVGAQRLERGLFEAVADEFLANEEIRAAHTELMATLDLLLERGKDAGLVRGDIGGYDVLMLIKGVCAAASALGDANPALIERHLDLIRAAISPPAVERPLRGEPPTLATIEQAHSAPVAEIKAAS